MSDDQRILTRFTGFDNGKHFLDPEWVREPTQMGVALDVETTGVNAQKDEIIELGLCFFMYDANDRIVSCGPGKSYYNQPAIPISEKITSLTGITNEMVAGHVLPIAEIEGLLMSASLIVAHNANFDRQFVERYSTEAQKHPWACSMTEVDWTALGAPSKALQACAWWHGFFFEGHRGDIDCEALVKLLADKPALASEPLFPQLIKSAREPGQRIWATNAPFGRKDDLSARGYQWHNGDFGHQKAWYIDKASAEEAAEEIAWLRADILPQGPDVTDLNATNRYSVRSFA
ncbi:3'-5' exonuclease [Parvibaculaceae bacterium PLY_AMNH_Bact1]|nr:3'-5' exonuclease [Parvibaculaceae bacterium PLY_AMNH_Bact1]